MPQLNYFLIFSQLTDLFSFLTVSVNLRLANFFQQIFGQRLFCSKGSQIWQLKGLVIMNISSRLQFPYQFLFELLSNLIICCLSNLFASDLFIISQTSP